MSDVKRLFVDLAKAPPLGTSSIGSKLCLSLLTDLAHRSCLRASTSLPGFSILEATASTLWAKATS